MILERLMPHYDFHERHATRVRARPERIYELVRHGELATHPIVRTLLFLRGLGGERKTFSLDLFLRQGFSLVADDPPREVVLAIEGPFWKPACKLRSLDEATLRQPVPSGVARAIWNFEVSAEGTVSTETRVVCADDSRGRFRLYWLFVRPFSGLIRRMMLRAIRRQAERA